MGWSSQKRCAAGSCNRPSDREVIWKAKAAGSSLFCEDHFREALRKYSHLMGTQPKVEPDARFSEKGPMGPEDTSQLEM